MESGNKQPANERHPPLDTDGSGTDNARKNLLRKGHRIRENFSPIAVAQRTVLASGAIFAFGAIAEIFWRPTTKSNGIRMIDGVRMRVRNQRPLALAATGSVNAALFFVLQEIFFANNSDRFERENSDNNTNSVKLQRLWHRVSPSLVAGAATGWLLGAPRVRTAAVSGCVWACFAGASHVAFCTWVDPGARFEPYARAKLQRLVVREISLEEAEQLRPKAQYLKLHHGTPAPPKGPQEEEKDRSRWAGPSADRPPRFASGRPVQPPSNGP